MRVVRHWNRLPGEACPIYWSVQGHLGWGPEHQGLVGGIPAHSTGVETKLSLRSLPTWAPLWFCFYIRRGLWSRRITLPITWTGLLLGMPTPELWSRQEHTDFKNHDRTFKIFLAIWISLWVVGLRANFAADFNPVSLIVGLGNRDIKILPSSLNDVDRHLWYEAAAPSQGRQGQAPSRPSPWSPEAQFLAAASLPSRAGACQVGQDPALLPVARLCGSAADLQRAGLKLPHASWLIAKAAPFPNQSQNIPWRLWLQLETKCKIIETSSYFFHKVSKLKKVL